MNNQEEYSFSELELFKRLSVKKQYFKWEI